MALTTAQRTTVRSAFVTLGTNNPGYVPAGQTPAQWADAQMVLLDAFRAQTQPRSYYTKRYQPFIVARMPFSATIRTAIDNHVNGL